MGLVETKRFTYLVFFITTALAGCSATNDADAVQDDSVQDPTDVASGGTGTSMSGGAASGGAATGGSRASGGSDATGGDTASGGTGGTLLPEAMPTDLFFQGLHYPTEEGDEWGLFRLSNPILATTPNGRTTAGGALVFETTSPTVTVNFRYNSGDVQRFGQFGLSQNGGAYELTNTLKDDETATVSATSDFPGELVRYQVTLPPWSNPILTSIDLDTGHQLETFTPPSRGAYVALGDSITHGVGQNTSFEGYAWQTAEDLDLELFNLATGGAKVDVPLANTLADWSELSLVTVLVGYNDWMFQGKTRQEYKDAYTELVTAIRVNHPHVPIVCLNLLDSNKSISDATGLPVSDFRNAISEVVSSFQTGGDSNIHFAPAESWVNDTSDLSDGVHLSVPGAANLADGLTSFIQSNVAL